MKIYVVYDIDADCDGAAYITVYGASLDEKEAKELRDLVYNAGICPINEDAYKRLMEARKLLKEKFGPTDLASGSSSVKILEVEVKDG